MCTTSAFSVYLKYNKITLCHELCLINRGQFVITLSKSMIKIYYKHIYLVSNQLVCSLTVKIRLLKSKAMVTYPVSSVSSLLSMMFLELLFLSWQQSDLKTSISILYKLNRPVYSLLKSDDN